jgi:hypothetical protein
VQPATCPPYADITDKRHGVPPFIVEDLRFVESFVDPNTQKPPSSRNHPRKTAAEQQDM